MVTTIEGIIENGKVRLPEGTVLPERQIVYVVIPDSRTNEPPKVPGIRLANPADAAKFEMTVLWEDGR